MGRTDDACVRLIALTKTILDGEGEDSILAEEEARELLKSDGFEQIPAWQPTSVVAAAKGITIEDFGSNVEAEAPSK